MTGLAAQITERAASSDALVRRRRVSKDIRAAREKLTSSIGLERAFDYELLRLFAQYRIGATYPSALLALVIAGTSALWSTPWRSAIGCVVILSALAVAVTVARRFLTQAPDAVSLEVWRRRFIFCEALQSTSWAIVIQALSGVDDAGARSFLLFILVMLAAVTATLSATVPLAVYAGFLPLTLMLVLLISKAPAVDLLMLVVMAAAAQLFFLFLANRLYRSAVATLQSRAEKDAIFTELEQAKANSDEARRRAEEANLAKSRFLATMSHELRTPLNAILGFSEVMKNEVFGPHQSPSYREYASDIHGSGQHLLTLINEILDLSRIEAGRYELNEEALQLAFIIEDCRHMMTLRARAKSQTIRELIDPTLPRLWADERAVRQIVLNLLSNAVKFTPPAGEITIKLGWTSSGGQYVAVCDTGPGIPEDEIPTVLSSFGRGSLAIKTAEQGSGLGLPIVKGLVELHGGAFQLKSKPREGTEAIVTFPAARVMDALPAMGVEASAATAPRAA